jgi:hypothetical protein
LHRSEQVLQTRDGRINETAGTCTLCWLRDGLFGRWCRLARTSCGQRSRSGDVRWQLRRNGHGSGALAIPFVDHGLDLRREGACDFGGLKIAIAVTYTE